MNKFKLKNKNQVPLDSKTSGFGYDMYNDKLEVQMDFNFVSTPRTQFMYLR